MEGAKLTYCEKLPQFIHGMYWKMVFVFSKYRLKAAKQPNVLFNIFRLISLLTFSFIPISTFFKCFHPFRSLYPRYVLTCKQWHNSNIQTKTIQYITSNNSSSNTAATLRHELQNTAKNKTKQKNKTNDTDNNVKSCSLYSCMISSQSTSLPVVNKTGNKQHVAWRHWCCVNRRQNNIVNNKKAKPMLMATNSYIWLCQGWKMGV